MSSRVLLLVKISLYDAYLRVIYTLFKTFVLIEINGFGDLVERRLYTQSFLLRKSKEFSQDEPILYFISFLKGSPKIKYNKSKRTDSYWLQIYKDSNKYSNV